MIEFKEPEKILLKDLNSLNGTYLNKQKIPNNSPVLLHDSDEISFGKDPTVYYFYIPPVSSSHRTSNSAGEVPAPQAIQNKKPYVYPEVNKESKADSYNEFKFT